MCGIAHMSGIAQIAPCAESHVFPVGRGEIWAGLGLYVGIAYLPIFAYIWNSLTCN